MSLWAYILQWPMDGAIFRQVMLKNAHNADNVENADTGN